MTGIDEVSAALGKLTAEAEASQNQRTLLFEQVKEMNQTLTGIATTIPTLMDTVNTHEDDIKKLKGFRMRLIGIATGVSMGSGILGGLLSKMGLN
jgi:hypothetical protein